MKLILLLSSFFFIATTSLSLYADEDTLEEEITKAFENYPFKCNPEGSTPEIAACAWIDLIKSDRDLREELNDRHLYEKWITARNEICNFFQDKLYAGGTIRQITRPGCALRVNNEVQKYCLTGDPTCG
tara:strand:+ start:508 stop:894 length:387 start_codon:yes stop_codon:yes gene_type:complete